MKKYERLMFNYIDLDYGVDMIVASNDEPTDWIDGSDWD